MQSLSYNEQSLTDELLKFPYIYGNRFDSAAAFRLRELLFRQLAACRDDYMSLLFPQGTPRDRSRPWSLTEAQGHETDGPEYGPAAKGTACGHIFKAGESTYSCKTCQADDTCVLCARCFEASDHEGHLVFVSVSPGNSGCCDCGDLEAWRKEVICSIHTAGVEESKTPETGKGKGKAPEGKEHASDLPTDLVESIRMTVARVMDYLCDVLSCSPEQLRLPKSEASIRSDEQHARLSGPYGSEPDIPEDEIEWALLLWNDEKHTVDDVQNQVARACSKTKKFGYEKAMEVNDIGRSAVHHSKDLPRLLEMAKVLEQIKVTVTIRSARDTFREQMCEALIDWIGDISGCAVGPDPYILRNTVCEEFLKPWRIGGSTAANRDIGQRGIDDHEHEDNDKLRRRYRTFMQPFAAAGLTGAGGQAAGVIRVEIDNEGDDDEDDDDDAEDENNEIDEEEEDNFDDEMEDADDGAEGMEIEVQDLQNAADVAMATRNPHDVADEAVEADMDVDLMDENEDVAEALEATLAGYASPPPPPPHHGREGSAAADDDGRSRREQSVITPADSEGEGEGPASDPTSRAPPPTDGPYNNVPKTPKVKGGVRSSTRPAKHWLEKPPNFKPLRGVEPAEDLWQRVRLDFLILYDLRLWKILRTNLRHLYITTVVTIPHFKRLLGLRYAGLYTALAQLYLIADREPDHSIINLSVQMLTTPSITEEVVERANFLTNLMAILYTFVTTRQVSFPELCSPRASLSFESGAVTNRRIFHFFVDLRWMFNSAFIQKKLREEQRYLLQFCDLAKLLQGVCPNVRKIGEHVEFESEGWIAASMVVKEIDRLAKMIGHAFELPIDDETEAAERSELLKHAIRMLGQVTMINAFGYERRRFTQAELRDDMAWHLIGPFDGAERKVYSVPNFVVQSEPMSFHHPLHYLLSWLLENGKAMSREEMRSLLHFGPRDLKDPYNPPFSRHGTANPPAPSDLTADELLSAIFEHPLRTYVWLSQMKSGMWVRNGITLRHQAHTYKSVGYRDVGYQRDLLMIQTGFVLCGAENERPGERYLAQVLDRFQMRAWFRGDYRVVAGFEEGQQMDCLEDLFHLLVIVLSERLSLVVPQTAEEKQEQDRRTMQRDIAHALCFKPLSFSDLAARVTEKVGESDEFQRVLEEMTTYRPPEGLSDTGVFELKPEFLEMVDPFYAHYTRNHREEAEGILRKHLAQKTGRKPEDVVVEPKLPELKGGMFSDLHAFTRTPLFAQTVGAALNFAAGGKNNIETLQVSRVETFLNMVLHLTLLATNEDAKGDGFTNLAADPVCSLPGKEGGQSIVSLLITLSGMDDYAACHSAIKHVLRQMQLRQPDKLSAATGHLGSLLDRADTGSPASLNTDEKEKKKQEALARQARVMAKMKEQQNSFLQTQGISAFGEDFDDLEGEEDMSTNDASQNPVEKRKTWEFPSGTCILCQEETDDRRLFGTFAFLNESGIVRTTPVRDNDFVREVVETPENLDRPADGIRPFGVARKNKDAVQRTTADGNTTTVERQRLSKGFPHQHEGQSGFKGPVSTSCGHIMHYSCFELYASATQRRHQAQIARAHPERVDAKEFICPLCKALGNTFLPIIWKAKECAHEHELHAAQGFGDWLADVPERYTADLSFLENAPAAMQRQQELQEVYSARSSKYVQNTFSPALVSNMHELSLDSQLLNSAGAGGQPSTRRSSLRSGYSLSSLFRLGSSTNSSGRDNVSPPRDTAPPRMAELVKAYHRIDETVRANRLCSPGKSAGVDWDRLVDRYTQSLLSNRGLVDASNELDNALTGRVLPGQIEDGTVNPVVPLSRALGLSVSAFEIAHRGQGDPMATSLLSDLTEQNVTHLRILSETIESFLAVNVLKETGTNSVARETAKKRDVMTAQLFGVESVLAMIKLKDFGNRLLFQEDLFLFFADWLGFMAPDVAEASELLQLCYWAEITKAVFVYKGVVNQQNPGPAEQGSQVSEVFKLAVSGMALEDTRDPYSRAPLSDSQLHQLRSIIEKYAVSFLRKAIVLMYVRYGLDFECPYNVNVEDDELVRLTALLHLPSLDDLCGLYTSQGAGSEHLRLMTKRWILQANMIAEHEAVGETSINLPHPTIFELIGLPKNYDALTQEAMRRKCPTTGKELTDPAICLFCGDIFCSQAVCCMKEGNLGGCQQHMPKCGGNIGIFINIRKCMALYMHNRDGSWAHAPYLDRHGEPDPTLRRHHQLYLNQKRYDKLYRDAWLNHMIPTVISRKLEGDINPGGWETL
ncbi:hypothetical protein KC347_g4270 [Hortaea werneckii]|nr:hypothetical protein KC347_g4270 [Hortaea werneckii]